MYTRLNAKEFIFIDELGRRFEVEDISKSDDNKTLFVKYTDYLTKKMMFSVDTATVSSNGIEYTNQLGYTLIHN